VAQLGQLDLKLAFMRSCPLRKNIENQRGPIEHRASTAPAQVALLDGTQPSVDQNQTGAPLGHCIGQLIGLARAHQKGRIGPPAASPQAGDHRDSG